MRHERSMPPAYFERMFRATDDPWDLETSAYEQAKYADTIAALCDRVYRQGFEVGCAKAVLTQKLAGRCRHLLAVDVSDTALVAARKRCAKLPGVSFARMAFPTEAPGATGFDLVVMSEVAYYWDDDDLARVADWLVENLSIGGDVLLVHWTGDTDYPQSGDDAVETLKGAVSMPLEVIRAARHERYRLDLWRRRS